MNSKKYSASELDKISLSLKNQQECGSPQDYEILVDDIVAVSRTSDLEHFLKYTAFIDQHSKYVEVRVYYGDSNKNRKHFFHFGEIDTQKSPKDERSLEGIVEERLAAEKVHWRLMELEKDNQRLRDEVHRLKKKNRKLKKLQNTEPPKNDFSLGNIISALSGVKAMLSGGNAPVQNQTLNGTEDSDVVVEEVEPEEMEDWEVVALKLAKVFPEEQTNKQACEILMVLSERPKWIEKVHTSLMSQIKPKEQEIEKQNEENGTE